MFLDAAVAIPLHGFDWKSAQSKFALAKIINVVVAVGLNFYFLKINYNPAVGIGFVLLAGLLANVFIFSSLPTIFFPGDRPLTGWSLQPC